jgi:uncharacterized membrane protein (UPF0127 family)
MKINNNQFSFLVADTTEELRQGLSGKDSLPKDEVLLFVFAESDYHGIWMKDMNFSIDIIWLDEQKKVVDLEANVSPDTYPESFLPDQRSKYVVETNAGVVESTGLQIGEVVEFTLP